MATPARKPWFAPKRYGYGAGRPIVWQGWVALTLYVVLMLAPVFMLRAIHLARLQIVVSVLCMVLWTILATAIFCIVCAGRTEGGWAWRWGKQ